MSETRRHFSADQKAQVVRRHLSGKEAISDLADELGVQLSQIHNWVKQVLDQADKSFQRTTGNCRIEEAKDRQIQQLRPNSPQRTRSSRNSWRRTSRQKSHWGTLTGSWPILWRCWPGRTRRNRRLPQALDEADRAAGQTALGSLGLATSKFHQWKDRYGKANEHNGQVPVTGGWMIEKNRRSSTTTTAIPPKATAAPSFSRGVRQQLCQLRLRAGLDMSNPHRDLTRSLNFHRHDAQQC